MKTLTVYDPPMCCSTGVCGPDVDPALPKFAGFLHTLKGLGVTIERHNLARQPMAFVTNPEVKAILERDGVEALPLIFIDGRLACRGAFPSPEDRIAWVRAAREVTPLAIA
ncbi:MAG TPA: arsenite efflux transporter metallochaperone ArsD [Opitutaceae bacterium]